MTRQNYEFRFYQSRGAYLFVDASRRRNEYLGRAHAQESTAGLHSPLEDSWRSPRPIGRLAGSELPTACERRATAISPDTRLELIKA
jgi:hypothetical protein